MIYNMAKLVASFLIIYLLGLLTFACIATMTLHENPNFENLYEAMRTFIMASLGNFDLYQHDLIGGWKQYFGNLLHLAVLFVNMILMINLLIAIMSDTYVKLTELRAGLFWSSVIQEMPKYMDDERYGALQIFPFVFSWLGLLAMPFLVLVKDEDLLKKINSICCYIVYATLSICFLTVFCAVNLALIPVAYLKTVIHKVFLFMRFRSTRYGKNLGIYIVLGIPFLLCAQITDVYRFLAHSYDSKQRQQTDETFLKTIRLDDFDQFLVFIDEMITQNGQTEMNAKELIWKIQEKYRIMQNIAGYIFGLQDASEKVSMSNMSIDEVSGVMQQENDKRQENLRQIKTYNMIKNAVWSCVLDLSVAKSQQMVNLALLNEVLVEIKTIIEFNKLKSPLSANASRISPADSDIVQQPESYSTKHLLKRFYVFSPIILKKTIVRCRNLGLILD